MDRQKKIKLLQDIQAGRRTAKDLMPKRLRIRIGKAGASFFCNDEPVSQEKFGELSTLDKPIKIVVKRV